MTGMATTRRDCLTLAVVWGIGAALFLTILLRGALPGAVAALISLAGLVAVIVVAYRRCGSARSATEERAAPAAEDAPAAAPVGVGEKPALLDRPREEGPDDLKRIKGVGPKLEALLHRLGVYHFDQVAAWTEREIDWVDDHLENFRGRARRDDWVSQARALRDGGDAETEHA